MASIVMAERPEVVAALTAAFKFSLISSLLTISTKSEKDNAFPVMPNLAYSTSEMAILKVFIQERITQTIGRYNRGSSRRKKCQLL